MIERREGPGGPSASGVLGVSRPRRCPELGSEKIPAGLRVTDSGPRRAQGSSRSAARDDGEPTSAGHLAGQVIGGDGLPVTGSSPHLGVIPTDSMALTMSPPWWTATMNWSLSRSYRERPPQSCQATLHVVPRCGWAGSQGSSGIGTPGVVSSGRLGGQVVSPPGPDVTRATVRASGRSPSRRPPGCRPMGWLGPMQ